MKDLTEIYIDLKKCTKEQRKEIARIINKNGHSITSKTNYELINGCYYELFPLLTYHEYWYCSRYASGKQELTYPEFIKLFEGGEGESQTFTKEDIEKAYRAGENKQTYYFKDTTVILPTTYEGVDG